jgi:hypothetical protein
VVLTKCVGILVTGIPVQLGGIKLATARFQIIRPAAGNPFPAAFLKFIMILSLSKKRSVFCISICSICLLLFSCKEKVANNSFDTLKVDFLNSRDDLVFSSIISTEVEIIPLSNQDDKTLELIYLNTINKMAIVGNEIFILDLLNAKKILVFDFKGNFIRYIAQFGEAPSEYLQPMDFGIRDSQISVLDVGKILTFDLNGNFLESVRINSIRATSFFPLSESGYTFLTSEREVDNLLLTDSDFNQVNSFFPYHFRALNPLLINPLYENAAGHLIYRRNLNDTLFKISNLERPGPYLYIDYGSKKVDLEKILSSSNPEQIFNESLSNYCNTIYFYESKNYNYLSFVLEGEKWINIYSKITGKTILFKNSNLDDDVTYDPFSYLVGVSGDKFFFLVKPEAILNSLFNIAVNSESRSHLKKMKSLASELDREDNPVLIGVEFNF